jgi:3D (Asp-Asp-Asp) domain-containing protein
MPRLLSTNRSSRTSERRGNQREVPGSSCGTHDATLRSEGIRLRMGRNRSRALVVVWLLTRAGCASPPPPAATPRSAPNTAAKSLTFTATAYCHGRVTAAGTKVAAGVVAADPAVLPVGTVIRIEGAAPYDGSYRVLDTGPRVRNRQVDLYIADCDAARRFGRRSVQVTIVNRAR